MLTLELHEFGKQRGKGMRCNKWPRDFQFTKTRPCTFRLDRQPCEVGMRVLLSAPRLQEETEALQGRVRECGWNQLRASERDPACALFVPQVWA